MNCGVFVLVIFDFEKLMGPRKQIASHVPQGQFWRWNLEIFSPGKLDFRYWDWASRAKDGDVTGIWTKNKLGKWI